MKRISKTLLRHPGGLIGFVILAIAIAVALFGPMLFPTSPWRMVQRPFLPPFAAKGFPLGTDALGRDVLVRTFYGARYSLAIATVVVTVSVIIGSTIATETTSSSRFNLRTIKTRVAHGQPNEA